MTSGEWNERYRQRGLVWTASPNRFLVSEVEGMRPGRALDLACGEGRNAVWLALQGWTVTGVDFSSVAIDKARGLADEAGVDVTWTVSDATAWESDIQYDLVLVFYLHLPPHQARLALSRAAQAVGPGGTLLVVGHGRRNLAEGYGGPPTLEVLYDAGEVVGILDELTIERAGEVLRPVDADGTTHTAIDVLVRASR